MEGDNKKNESERDRKVRELLYDSLSQGRRISEIVESMEKMTSKVIIGEFAISRSLFSEGKIWIEHSSGEAGEFDKKLFEKTIQKFYDKHF